MRALMTWPQPENTLFLIFNTLLGLASVLGFRDHQDQLHRPRLLKTPTNLTYYQSDTATRFRDHLDHLHRPRFLNTATNFTYYKGDTATLLCSVDDLGTKTVTWRRSSHVLTVGKMTFTPDKEYEVMHTHADSTSWNLLIKNVQLHHADKYECQVSTSDKMTRFVYLSVIEDKQEKDPDIQISGPFHIDKGLTIRLECNATGTATPPDAIDWFKNGNKVESNADENVQITKAYLYSAKRITSVLEIRNSKMGDTGTYTCRTSDQVTSVNVHILNAEKTRKIRDRDRDDHLPQSQQSGTQSNKVYDRNKYILTLLLTAFFVKLNHFR